MNKNKKLTIEEKFHSTTEETLALAVQNHKKNNLQTAENYYNEVLKINPNHFESNYLLGGLLAQTKRFNLAKSLFQKSIKINPNSADAHYNLGVVLQELGDNQKAIISFEKAIEIKPNYAKAYSNLGVMLQELGDNQKAIRSFEKTIQIEPNFADTHYNLGVLLQQLQQYQKAISCYEKAIQIDPNHISTINRLSELIKIVRLNKLTKNNYASLKKLILFLYRKNNINHADIFYNAKLVLLTEINVRKLKEIVNSNSSLLKNKILQNLLKEELFLLMLQKSLIIDKFLEKLLTKIRNEILFNLINFDKKILKEYFDFIVSLAEQGLFNEYVYVQTKKEIYQVNKLKNKIENKKKINELEIAILGCYIPIHNSKKIINKLLNYNSKNNLFNDLITIQIKEPLKEIELANSIKSFNKITDNVSNKVREQYEEHPYPRWRYTYKNLHSSFLIRLNNEINPNKVEYSNKFVNPNILIAGCGTGQHTTTVERYQNANILGVDLSLASLAYAKRKTEELELKNIDFLHADILQLNNLNKKFDVIECVGTLHHMQDPLAGLKILLDLLEPHGFMKLGLYSEIARQSVVKARKLIKRKKFKNTVEDIRNFRESIINEKQDPLLQKIFQSKDFYSTSMARDLMFHIQEHRFTLPEISKILKNLNLEFLGFANPFIKKKFSKLFVNDKKNISLNNWNQFEMNNPDTFYNMYQFWVRKI